MSIKSKVRDILRDVLGREYLHYKRRIMEELDGTFKNQWRTIIPDEKMQWKISFDPDYRFIPTGEYRLDFVVEGECLMRYIFPDSNDPFVYLPCIRVGWRDIKHDRDRYADACNRREYLLRHHSGWNIVWQRGKEKDKPACTIQPRMVVFSNVGKSPSTPPSSSSPPTPPLSTGNSHDQSTP